MIIIYYSFPQCDVMIHNKGNLQCYNKNKFCSKLLKVRLSDSLLRFLRTKVKSQQVYFALFLVVCRGTSVLQIINIPCGKIQLCQLDQFEN